jgi:signal transduction histidine kinase/CheY-like chemotaxis protein
MNKLSRKELWQSIMENPTYHVMVVDQKGLIHVLNEVETDLDGDDFKIENIIGKARLEDLLPEEQKHLPRNALKAVFEEGFPCYTYETQHEEMGIYFRSIMMPVKRDDKVIAATIISSNITEEKKLEQDLLKSAKLASIGELAAGVGHEVNNPLMIINYALDIIHKKLTEEQADKKILDSVYKAQKASERISKIVSSLMTYARFDHELTTLSLNSTIHDATQIFESIFKKKGITIEHDLTDSEAFIEGDEGKIHQIISNLLTNARDALEEVEEPQIKISTEVKDEHVILKVKDNGEGIDPNIKDKIFDSFYTTKEIGKGTGLGLSVIQNLVYEMGGSLNYNSIKGKETEFIIEFPLSHKVKNGDSTDSGLVGVFNYDDGILVVDDEPDIVEYLEESLKVLGLKNVYSTNNPIKALDILKKNKVRILITDYNMPSINGLELIKKIKNEKRGPTQFILLSGHLDYRDSNISEFSADELIVARKPISFRNLSKSLKKFIKN